METTKPIDDRIPVDLTGCWEGYFSRSRRTRPIRAEFEQTGDAFEGQMNDEVTDLIVSVSELALEAHLPPGTDEQIVENLRLLCPDAELEPVKAEEHSPSDSRVNGTVDGRLVWFEKTYQGKSFTGFRVGHYRVGKLDDSQRVQYFGTVSADGTQIRGQWRLTEETQMPLHADQGTFVLWRSGSGNPEHN